MRSRRERRHPDPEGSRTRRRHPVRPRGACHRCGSKRFKTTSRAGRTHDHHQARRTRRASRQPLIRTKALRACAVLRWRCDVQVLSSLRWPVLGPSRCRDVGSGRLAPSRPYWLLSAFMRMAGGFFVPFGVGLLWWVRADRAGRATVVGDERCEGGDDARPSTVDEFPRPRDPDDQR